MEAIKDLQNNVDELSNNLQFRCSINNDAYEDILTYSQILKNMSKDEEHGIVWKFKDIIGHKGPINKNHQDYIGSPYNVTVLWENGEEPFSMIVADDPVSCAIYACENDLLDLPGWRRFRTLAKKQTC